MYFNSFPKTLYAFDLQNDSPSVVTVPAVVALLTVPLTLPP